LSSRFLLHYAAPAESFNAALPLGNGRLGAMFYGGVAAERIHLNEDTLWSGVGPAEIPPQGRAALPEIRRLLFAGDHRAAHELAIRTLPGPFTEAYQPAGDLLLDLLSPPAVASDVSGYERSLDLSTATGLTRFTIGSVTHQRELFVSHPAQVVALRWLVSQPGALSVRLRLACPLRHRVTFSQEGIHLSGRAPSRVEWFRAKPGQGINYDSVRDRHGLAFDVRLVVEAPGAIVTAETDALRIEGATELRLLLDARTTFHHGDSDAVAAAIITRARSRPWDALRAEHCADPVSYTHLRAHETLS
jgi:alpha-L-fucosidase 2